MADEIRALRGRNTALEARMKQLRMSPSRLAHALGVPDPKTVDRWIAGTVPRREYASGAAKALGCQLWDLWPEAYPCPDLVAAGQAARNVYTSRRDVPPAFWAENLGAVTEALDICVYGGTFLFDQVQDFQGHIDRALGRGAAVRVLVGDPDSAAVQRRGVEEGIGDDLAFRCRMTLKRIRQIPSYASLHLRTHDTTLYASLFRFDDTIAANHHIWGLPASDNPVLIVDRVASPALWTKYTATFERIWDSARSVEPDHEET